MLSFPGSDTDPRLSSASDHATEHASKEQRKLNEGKLFLNGTKTQSPTNPGPKSELFGFPIPENDVFDVLTLQCLDFAPVGRLVGRLEVSMRDA
jgi:hypothetical protein